VRYLLGTNQGIPYGGRDGGWMRCVFALKGHEAGLSGGVGLMG
jgi:hypothetical protein